MPVGKHSRIANNSYRVSFRCFIIFYLERSTHNNIALMFLNGKISAPRTDIIQLSFHSYFYFFFAQYPSIYDLFRFTVLFLYFYIHYGRLYNNLSFCITGTCLCITKFKYCFLRIRLEYASQQNGEQ